jgi:hypothetical protein
VDGSTWDLDGWPGMHGHNWGTQHANEYVWAHCDLFEGDTQALFFEGLSARVALGPLPILTPPLTLACLDVDGARYVFNDPLRLLRHQSRYRPMRWELCCRADDGTTLYGTVQADLVETAGLYYENPNGAITYCCNSKLARLDLELVRPGLRSVRLHSRAAALEIGTRDPNHGVTMFV